MVEVVEVFSFKFIVVFKKTSSIWLFWKDLVFACKISKMCDGVQPKVSPSKVLWWGIQRPLIQIYVENNWIYEAKISHTQ